MKSVYAIGGLGAAGCLVLSFMMQHLLKVRIDQGCGPVAAELAEMSAGKLVGRPHVEIVDRGGVRTMVIQVQTCAGVDRSRYATGTGRVLWLSVQDMKDPPAHICFEVADEGGAPPITVEVPSPDSPAFRRRAVPGAPPVPAPVPAPAPAPGSRR